MNNVKVAKVSSDSLEFSNGMRLYSEHNQDCCEQHWLSFSDLSLEDFEGLEFDLQQDSFFERIEGYGIAIKPIFGHKIRVPGYSYNNGYYSSNLDLVLTDVGERNIYQKYDITECQKD